MWGRKRCLVLGQGEVLDHVGRAVGQAGVHVERGVGAALQLLEDHLDRRAGRRSRPTSVGMANDTRPSSKSFFQASLKPARRRDLAVLEAAAGAVRRPVQRAGHLGDEAGALIDDRVALRAGEVRVALVLEELLDVQVLVEGEVDGAAVELVGVLRVLRAWNVLLGRSGLRRQANAAPCQAWRPFAVTAMLEAMSSAGRPLEATYPYWLAGEAVAPNHDLEVRDKYSGERGDPRRHGRRPSHRRGDRGGRRGGRADAPPGGLRAPGRADALRAPLPGALRRAGDEPLHRGRQADQGQPRRGDAPHRHLPHRRRGGAPNPRRGAADGHLAARARLHRHVEARADRAVLVHLAVQLPAQPRRAQDRAGARRRLPVRAEAGEPDPDRRAADRRGPRRDRRCRVARSPSCPAAATAPISSPPTTA